MKRIGFLVLCMAVFLASNAQTYYYALTKIVYSNGRTEVQSGNQGQFVNREKGLGQYHCYDCTSNGKNHLNGNLYFVANKGDMEVFKGKSYWGSDSQYKFCDARGLLNVVDRNGTTYVFKRATPPSGRTRSSFLVSGAAQDGWDARDHWVDPSGGQYNTTPSKSGKSSTTRRSSSSSATSSRTCSACHGAGRVRTNVGTGGYGVNNSKRHCNTCGKDYYVTSDHWHKCPSCNGTGRQ